MPSGTEAESHGGNTGVYAFMRADYARRHEARAEVRHYGRRHRVAERHHHRLAYRHHRVAYRHHRGREAYAMAPASGGFSGNSLVADARRYLGTNPTRRRTLWCGAFVDKVLRDTGHRGGGNLALGYLHYGHRVAGPRVGAIAVMRRRGGGHVGVVAGVDANGNPIIISGNHNHTTAVSVYPRHRIVAYVMPNS